MFALCPIVLLFFSFIGKYTSQGGAYVLPTNSCRFLYKIRYATKICVNLTLLTFLLLKKSFGLFGH